MYPPLDAARAARRYTPDAEEKHVLDACRTSAYAWGGGAAVAASAVALLVTRRLPSAWRRARITASAAAVAAVCGAASTSARCMDSILLLDRRSRLRADFITTVLRYNPDIVPVVEPEWEREVLERQRREANK